MTADNRHSNGNKSRPSSSRHLSILLLSGIYTISSLSGKETVSISVQYIIALLSLNNLILYNKNTTESNRSAPYLDWVGWSTSHFHLRRLMALSFHSWYDIPLLASHMNIQFWELGGFPISYSNRDISWNIIHYWTLEIVIPEALWSIRGSFFYKMNCPYREY